MSPRPGRCLVIGYEGVEPPAELFAFAGRHGLGGVILFARNCPDAPTVARAVASLRVGLAGADPGGSPLVLVDQEGGRVERLRHGVPRLPSARELGARGEAALAAAVTAQARALAALGIDGNLAPVCDVVQPGESGAIGDRSFGADPGAVARLAVAHLRATRAGGLLACAKHFPGHGAARVDSHRELPRVDKDLLAFEALDLVPFRAAVAAGVPLVMAAHVLCPAVAPRPATLAPEWLRGVLRERLGFGGLVLSDDLEMGALAELGAPGAVAVEAVNAGCDLLIYGRMLEPGLALAEVAHALGAGVSGARLAEAEARRQALGGAP